MEDDDKKSSLRRGRTNSRNQILNEINDSKSVFNGSSNELIYNKHDEVNNLKSSIDCIKSLNTSNVELPKTSVFVSARNLSSSVKSGTKDEKKILTDLNFFLKPGSMVLLLGSPGCGKSSLIQTLALLTNNEEITGNLLFNGKLGDPLTHHRHVSFVPQDDSHMAPLTVRDTFKFSADCQLGDKTEKERNERVDNVLDFLGLDHVQNTVVGDEFLRGISGGQKKRVTIGVEMIKDSNLLLMDEPTNGLDSSISLEMLTKIKNKVTEEKLSCLISLLQPGLEITKLFDYLMIMNQGQMSYFGPMNQAIGYFEGLGFRFPKHHNPAEFFQEIVDEPDLYYEGDGGAPLKGAEEFALAYRKSNIYKFILEYIDSHIPSVEESSKFIDYSTTLKPYSISFWRQLQLNVKRGFKISIGNLSSLRMRLIKNIVMGFILGTLYWKLGLNQVDGNSRSGLLFFSLLTFVFGGFSSIAIFFKQRSVFYQQRSWKYYDTMSFFFSMIINDIPMSILEVLIFSNFVYWMAGLNKTSWDRFIYFVLMSFFSDVLSQAMLRMVCSFTPNGSIATTISPAFISPFILICGFMQKKPSIPKYWVWVYWISPIHYGFEGLLLNEHSGLEYHCDNHELVPPSFLPTLNQTYPIGFEGNQVCPITKGEQILDSLGFSTKFQYRWIDLAIVGGFILLFWTITAICMKFLIFRVYRKDPIGIKKSKTTLIKNNRNSIDSYGGKEKASFVDVHEEMKVIDIKSPKANLKKEIPNGCYMQWKDLIYEVDVKKKGKTKKLRLLNGINGYVKPGILLALMGPSGAGKSTLLDVLANRKTGGHTKGEVLINGQERTKYFTRTSAYVEQFDVLPPTQTVREAILFSAINRLQESVPLLEKEQYVDNILETLNLTKIQHSLIGDIESGLSLSQRKRTNMGIELASDPQLLFLDEPTSGLDSSAALKVMNLIKKIASSGRAVICTIHQPSTTIFKKFDHLLLLKRGGETVYFGPTGTDSKIVLDYFAEKGLVCDEFKNPADFILDVTDDVIEIPCSSNGDIKLFNPVESFKESKLNENLLSTIVHSIMPEGTPIPIFHGKYSSSMSTQFKELIKRAWLGQVRRIQTIRSRIGRSLLLGIIIGTLFLRLEKEQADVYNRLSLLFFSLMFGGMAAMSVIPMVDVERGIFYREQSSGMYRVWIYYITFILSDIPWVILASYAYVVPVYFLTGLSLAGNGWAFFYHSFISIFVYLNFSIFGIFLASTVPIQEMAFVLNGVTLSIASLFAGFMIPPPSMPSAWKWLYYLDFIAYPLRSYLITELKDMEFVCTDNVGAVPVPIPSKNTTKFFCPIQNGSQVLAKLEFKSSDQYWNLLITSAFTVFFLIIGFLSFKFIRYQNK